MMDIVNEIYCLLYHKQRMLKPSSHHITDALMVSPEGTQGRIIMPAIKPPNFAAAPVQTQGEKTQKTGHRENWGVHQKNDFSEPRLLDFPTHRKVVNSLTWDIWFSINSNLLMFQLSGLCYKNSYIYPGSSLRVLWTGRRSNQSILKEINHE